MRDRCVTFFIIFLMIFRCPIFSDFGANLGPTWRPSWTPNPPKSFPRGFQIPSQLASCFEYPVLSILGASWVDFWWVLGAKLGAKFTKKSITWPLVGNLAETAKILKNLRFARFWSLGLPTSKQNRQKGVPRPIKNQAKFRSAS